MGGYCVSSQSIQRGGFLREIATATILILLFDEFFVFVFLDFELRGGRRTFIAAKNA